MKAIINYFRKYPYALILVLIMLIWGTINTIDANKHSKKLQRYGKYTLATITKIKGAKSGRWVTVEFDYKGSKITTEAKNETIPQSWIGEKIFIKFLPSRPVVSEYLDGLKVPDSLANLTPTIWDSLPVRWK